MFITPVCATVVPPDERVVSDRGDVLQQVVLTGQRAVLGLEGHTSAAHHQRQSKHTIRQATAL